MTLNDRYLVNVRSGMVHDRDHLSEACNSDQIPRQHRAYVETLREASHASRTKGGYVRLCRWCLGQRRNKRT